MVFHLVFYRDCAMEILFSEGLKNTEKGDVLVGSWNLRLTRHFVVLACRNKLPVLVTRK